MFAGFAQIDGDEVYVGATRRPEALSLTAESVEVDCDEGGWYLAVETDEGQRLQIRVPDATALAGEARKLNDWLAGH